MKLDSKHLIELMEILQVEEIEKLTSYFLLPTPYSKHSSARQNELVQYGF